MMAVAHAVTVIVQAIGREAVAQDKGEFLPGAGNAGVPALGKVMVGGREHLEQLGNVGLSARRWVNVARLRGHNQQIRRRRQFAARAGRAARRQRHGPPGRSQKQAAVGQQHPGQAGQMLVAGHNPQVHLVVVGCAEFVIPAVAEQLGVQVLAEFKLAALVEQGRQLGLLIGDQRLKQRPQRHGPAFDADLGLRPQAQRAGQRAGPGRVALVNPAGVLLVLAVKLNEITHRIRSSALAYIVPCCKINLALQCSRLCQAWECKIHLAQKRSIYGGVEYTSEVIIPGKGLPRRSDPVAALKLTLS
jgi:hypothetical protein